MLEEQVQRMTEGEVRELLKDKEKAKMVVDGLRMEAWLKVKKALEDEDRVATVFYAMQFLEKEIGALIPSKEKIMEFFSVWCVSLCVFLDEVVKVEKETFGGE